MKYSICTCTYERYQHFQMFLESIANQTYPEPFELIVADNGSKRDDNLKAAEDIASDKIVVKTIKIPKEERKTTNITQGINLAAQQATGEYIIIIADSTVIVSYNMMSEIDKVARPGSIVLSSKCDVKVSFGGRSDEEYIYESDAKGFDDTMLILNGMGFDKNKDPFYLKLIPGFYRFPWQHETYDVYMICLIRNQFPGYDENITERAYHRLLVAALANRLKPVLLQGKIRIVHLLHKSYFFD